jgi:hypothetical protein
MAGRQEESLRAIDEAVRLSPRATEPYYNRGLTLEALGRTDEARRQIGAGPVGQVTSRPPGRLFPDRLLTNGPTT